MKIIIAIIIFSAIILFHELGHFLLAKKNHIVVTEFSLGMGPRILSTEKNGTRYSWKLLPIGGSCAMLGEDTDEEDEPGTFNSASVWGRISVVAAGPVFNFIMAFVLSVIIVGVMGYEPSTVTSVKEGSAAETAGLQEGDVITNVNLRWPSVTFKVVHVHVQGEQCPAEVVQAIAQLDADPSVDVIIVARGGGSFEDLIGFSDERVVRAAYACTTPLISSIGHEDDWTLLDLVADLRASTPTDAAKRVVPDVREQSQLIEGAIDRMRLRVRSRVENEIRLIEGYANRPSLTQPHTMLEPHQRLIDDSLQRLDIGLRRIVDDAQLTVERAHASLTALSPQSTLNRGYAVVQSADGHVLDDASRVSTGDDITVTLKKGVITATATSATATA